MALKNKRFTDSDGNTLAALYSSDNYRNGILRANGNLDTLTISGLVPDPGFRSLLNRDAEIIVGDTLYRITPNGTLFCELPFMDELRNYVLNTTNEIQVGTDLYKNGNIYRYDTFFGVDLIDDPILIDGSTIEDINNFSCLKGASNIPAPNISSFPSERASKWTFFGKLLQGLGQRKAITANLGNRKDRRINAAVFDYNYLVYQSVGLTAKVQKKWWYGGWTKVVNWPKDQLRIGFRNVVIKYPYPSGSSYSEIYTKVFGSIPSPYQHPTPGSILVKPKNGSIWNQHGTIEVDLSYLPMIEISSPSLGDLLEAAKGHITSLAVSYNKSHNNFIDPLKGIDVFSEVPREQRSAYLDEILAEMDLHIPVFAKDGIYVLIPAMSLNNKENETELTLRLAERYTNFMLTYSSTIDGNLKSFYKDIKLTGLNNPDIKLVRGDFFACAYMGNWSGFRLYW